MVSPSVVSVVPVPVNVAPSVVEVSKAEVILVSFVDSELDVVSVGIIDIDVEVPSGDVVESEDKLVPEVD